MPVSTNTFFVAHRFRKSLTESDTHIFYGVVSINVQVTIGSDIEIDQTMARNLIKHVIEKRHTRVEFLLTGTIDINDHPNLGFVGIANYFCCTCHG